MGIGVPRSARSSPDEFSSRLGALAERRRQRGHPWSALFASGRLDAGDIRLWAANHYEYLRQTRIGIEGALLAVQGDHSALRQPGAIRSELELWRRLGAAVGLGERELESGSELLPAVRTACEDFVERLRRVDALSAVAYHYGEYFAPQLLALTTEAGRRHYSFVPEDVFAACRQRAAQAAAAARSAFNYLCREARTGDERQRCLAALEHSCSISWRLLDAIYVARRRASVPRISARAELLKLSSLASPGERGRGTAPGMLMMPGRPLWLNRTAYDLVESCDGQLGLEQIIRQLAHRHRTEPETVERDVARFVAELERRRILIFAGGAS